MSYQAFQSLARYTASQYLVGSDILPSSPSAYLNSLLNTSQPTFSKGTESYSLPAQLLVTHGPKEQSALPT